MRRRYGRKVRRVKVHRRIYRKNRSRSVLKVILICVGIAALIFVGYSLAGPIMNLVTGKLDDTSSIGSNQSTSSTASQTPPASSSSTPQTPASSDTRAAVLPAASLGDLSKVEAFVKQAKADGYNAVAVLLKNETGELLYNSQNELAQKYGAVKGKTVELAPVVKLITDNGLTPVAEINTFKDKTAANRENKNTYLIKGDSGSTWWDNSPGKGGKPWLNPYTDQAKDYILGLTDEILDAGFKQMIYLTVQFPDVRNTSPIAFPEGANAEMHQKTLTDFIAAAQERVSAKGAKLTVAYDLRSVIGQKDNIYFGNPLNLGAKSVAPIIKLDQLGSKLKLGDTTVEKPSEKVDEAMAALVAEIKAKTGGADICPIISDKKAAKIASGLEAAGVKAFIEVK